MQPDEILSLVREIRGLRVAALFVGIAVLFHVAAEVTRSVWQPAEIRPENSRNSADLLEFAPPVGDITNTATGNTVTVNTSDALPASPRTVEQVADYLGVTPDTVHSYIQDWIQAGHMSEEDKAGKRWLIPETFVPYRPR